MKKDKLAINGGTPAVNFPLKPRGHFGEEEQASVLRLFSQAIRSGLTARKKMLSARNLPPIWAAAIRTVSTPVPTLCMWLCMLWICLPSLK